MLINNLTLEQYVSRISSVCALNAAKFVNDKKYASRMSLGLHKLKDYKGYYYYSKGEGTLDKTQSKILDCPRSSVNIG